MGRISTLFQTIKDLAEIYNTDHYFNIKLYDYNSLEDYQEAIED